MCITFDDIAKDPKHKLLIDIIQLKYGSPIPEEIKKLVLENSTRSVERVNQTARWVDLLRGTTKLILAEDKIPSVYPLFWIYLHGTLTEMISDFEEYEKAVGIPELFAPIYESLLNIVSLFNEDEIRFIKFMRHNHVHLHLDYYWSKTKTKNGEIVKIKVPSESDARDNADKIINNFGGEQSAVAQNFADRIKEELEILYTQVNKAVSTV